MDLGWFVGSILHYSLSCYAHSPEWGYEGSMLICTVRTLDIDRYLL